MQWRSSGDYCTSLLLLVLFPWKKTPVIFLWSFITDLNKVSNGAQICLDTKACNQKSIIKSPELWKSIFWVIQSSSIYQHQDRIMHINIQRWLCKFYDILCFTDCECKSLCGSLREMLSPVFCMSTCVLLYCIEGVIRVPCRWLTQQVALKSVCKLRLMRGGFDFPLISLSKAWPPMWGMAALNANPLLLSCVSQCDHDYKPCRTKCAFFLDKPNAYMISYMQHVHVFLYEIAWNNSSYAYILSIFKCISITYYIYIIYTYTNTHEKFKGKSLKVPFKIFIKNEHFYQFILLSWQCIGPFLCN